MRNAYTTTAGKPRRKRSLSKSRTDGRVILKLLYKGKAAGVCAGFNSLRKWSSGCVVCRLRLHKSGQFLECV